MYLNKVILIGNLTKDPELKALPNGTPVANFSLATNRTWKDKNGVKQEDVQFHNVVVFGAQADTIAKWMKKGSSILVEGRLQTRSWDSPEGKKYRTEIIGESFQFGQKPTGTPSAATKTAIETPLDTIEYPEEEINPDDIPF